MTKCDFSNTRNKPEPSKRKKEQQRINAEIKAVYRYFESQPERREAFERLVLCMRSHTSLLKPSPGLANAGWAAATTLINRLKNLASRRALWIRNPESWHPADTSLRLAFRSLAHHLLARYPVPAYMDAVWDLPAGAGSFRQQVWYIRLGRGASLRELNLPLRLTRQMEHWTRLAPDHYTILQALRYGEIRGLGGTETLAREIVLGRLGQKIERDAFWRSVFFFLAKYPETPREQVNPIIDFIHHHRFGDEELVAADGTILRTAPCPEFSVAGRTLKSMLRLVEAWHVQLGRKMKSGKFSWPSSGIPGHCFKEDYADREWNIRELLSSDALHADGKAMRHCVYTYATACHRRETTIWSLSLRTEEFERRMVTIQVNHRKHSIIQVRAKCNRMPGARSMEIIRHWAASVGLHLALSL